MACRVVSPDGAAGAEDADPQLPGAPARRVGHHPAALLRPVHLPAVRLQAGDAAVSRRRRRRPLQPAARLSLMVVVIAG